MTTSIPASLPTASVAAPVPKTVTAGSADAPLQVGRARGRWQQQGERGAKAGVLFMFWVARHLGRRTVGFLMFFPVLWFFLTGRTARKAIREYLERLARVERARAPSAAMAAAPALQRRITLFDVWRSFARFGGVCIDRFYLLSGQSRYEVKVQGDDMVEGLLQHGGAMLLVAHFGGFESMRVPATRQRSLPVSILMDRAQGPMVTAVFEAVDPSLAAGVINAAEGGPQLVLKLREALAAGKLVGVMADRARRGEPTLSVDFLGSPAPFPLSPWQLALALKCPVVLGFSICRGRGRYETHFELFTPGFTTVPRAERGAALAAAVQGYAARLEHWVHEAPDNWFNFYPFWADAAVEAESKPEAVEKGAPGATVDGVIAPPPRAARPASPPTVTAAR